MAELFRLISIRSIDVQYSAFLLSLELLCFYRMELNVQSLHARLHHLWNSLKQSQQLITRLSKLTSQVGASPSNPDEGNARVDLSAEIHQCLKEQEEEFELLRQEAEDHTNNPSWSSVRARRGKVKGKEREDLAAQVARFGQDLKMCSTPLCFKRSWLWSSP